MQELFSIAQIYIYFLFKQILKYKFQNIGKILALLVFRALAYPLAKTKCAKMCGCISACG
ncbi:MAG TPA: hypothetical protein DER05_13245 [Lutibacter sp.]|nr:hypothetical protein [Lutibacter sp.]